MNKRIRIAFVFMVAFSAFAKAQYQFTGTVNKEKWEGNVYLSLVNDYRKVSGIHPAQIINKTTTDSQGYFTLENNNLPEKPHIYKLHIDNCSDNRSTALHYLGHCENSVAIPFIASANDTIHFPASFDRQTFCSIISNNERSNALLKIDSLKEVYAFDISSATSTTAVALNAKKWITQFQNLSKKTNEPLAQLYMYAFISDRSGELYPYYIEDLQDNTFYNTLAEDLENKYPNEAFTTQYHNDLKADKAVITSPESQTSTTWLYAVVALAIASLLFNIYLIFKNKNKKRVKQLNKATLTSQEQKIVTAILENKSNKEIASEMYVSLSTVKTHINNVYKKLNISSRDELKSYNQ